MAVISVSEVNSDASFEVKNLPSWIVMLLKNQLTVHMWFNMSSLSL
jgi:hypothetical protein